MTNVLAINSSLNGENGNSNKLVATFLEKLQSSRDVSVNVTDLYENALPHLTQAEMGAWMTDPAERTDEQKALATISDDFIAQVQNADVLVIGMPMYNFGIPSAFKAWVDRIARAGVTFRYTENGPQGLLTDKKVYVLAARGGKYEGTPLDTQTNYIKDFFSFVGLKDVEFVFAEGLAMGGDSTSQSFSTANEKIIELIEKLPV